MNIKDFLELSTFAMLKGAPEEAKERIFIDAQTPDGKRYDIGPVTLTADGSMAPKLTIHLRDNDSLTVSSHTNVTENQKLSPFRAGKQCEWCGAICKINNFIKYLDKDEPIIGGSWNPNDYVDKIRFDEILEWFNEHCPECLNPNNEENILYASMGTTFENKEQQEHAVDIFEVVDNWIEDFAGKCIDGRWVKAPAFGGLGIGSKYFAIHFYKRGAIIIKGEGDEYGERRVKFALFFPEDIWRAMGISVHDVIED